MVCGILLSLREHLAGTACFIIACDEETTAPARP
jgi:hypothetical protein